MPLVTTDRSYYDRLKRRYMAAEKDYWDNRDRPGVKDGEDVLLEETPSNPSELRQYIELLCVFADDMREDTLKSLYQESVNLLEMWEKERPGNLDLEQARTKLKGIKKQVKKNKLETVPAIIIAVLMLAGFIAALIIFPGFANLVKKVFWIEYIKGLIVSLFTL